MTKQFAYLMLWWSLLLVSLNILAQPSALLSSQAMVHSGPIVNQISQVAGEPLSGVKSILQSQSGFIWLASSEGLLRFDGQNIKRFTHQVDNPNSLPANDVRGMVEDQQGIIWLITRGGGLSRFTPQTEQFVNFQPSDDADTIDSDLLNSIALGQNNQLWIGSDKGINRFDRLSFKNVRLNSQMLARAPTEYEHIQHIFVDDQQRIWFAVRRQGLYLHIPQGNRTLHFAANEDDANSLDSKVISEIYQQPNGDIWIGTALSVSRFNSQTLNFTRFTIPLKESNKVRHASVTSMAMDEWGNLWVGTFYNGVSVLYQGAKQLTDIQRHGKLSDSLHAMQINDLLQDKQGGLWLVTARDGLTKVAPEQLLFDHHIATTAHPASLTLNNKPDATAMVMAENGVIWLLQQGRLARYLPQVQRFEFLTQQQSIVDIVASRQWGLLVALEQGGFARIDVQNGNFTPLFADITLSVERLILDDENQLMWFRVKDEEGIYRYDLQSQQLQRLFAEQKVTAVTLMSSGLYIAVADEGIKRFDQQQQSWFDVGDKIAAVNQIVSTIPQSSSLLVATDHGLYQNNLNTRLWTKINQKGEGRNSDNWPSAFYSVVDIEPQHWWASTNLGVYRVDKHTGDMELLNQSKGLRLESISAKAPVRLLTQELFVAGFTDEYGAVMRFNPQHLAKILTNSMINSDILLTDFKLFNQSVALKFEDVNSPLVTTINQTEHLQLSYQQNWFSLLFTSQLYQASEDIRYAYKLEGLSDQWIEIDGPHGEATFTSVDAGNYIFKVKTTGIDGQWQQRIRQLPITIKPAWWDSPLAYVLYLLFSISLILLINHLRTRQLRYRAQLLEDKIKARTETISGLLAEKEELLEDKDRLIANISHEFRTPLTLILGPLAAQIAQGKEVKNNEQLILAEANANRLLYMVDQLLDLARLKNPRDNAMKAHDLITTLTFLVESFEPLAKARKTQLKLTIEPQQSVWVMAQQDALEKIVTNLLSNALKYSDEGGMITVTLNSLSNDKVQFSVKDSGFGMSEDDLTLIFKRFARIKNTSNYTPGSGIGLALVKELLLVHQGDIEVSSQLGVGSTFTVTLPVISAEDVEKGDLKQQNMVNTELVEQNLARINLRQSTEIDQNQLAQESSLASILVIEDNADMREFLVASLKPHYQCLQAQDGEQGLQVAQAFLPDLVISDVMMPKMDGFAVTEQLKQHQNTNHIPVILLTARGDRESRIKGWSQKADEYLEKPFNTTELLMRIDNLLAIRQLLRKRFSQAFIATSASEVVDKKAIMSESEGSLPQQNDDIEAKGVEQQSADNTLSPAHQMFLDQINKVLEKHYQDSEFDVATFASQMALSHRQLGRKIKSILDMTPAEALRNYRLTQAATLLKQGIAPSVVAHQVGFTTHSYFSQCFKARFNCLPSQFCHKA